MPTHDPEKAIAALRDHLARHDKPLALLCGAGTSCSAGNMVADKWEPFIPAVAGLTGMCKEEASKLGPDFAPAWELIEGQCKADGQDTYIESILSRVRMMLRAVGNKDTLCGLNKEKLGELEASIQGRIAKAVAPDLSQLPQQFPHDDFATWVARSSRTNPIEIFTLNYDVLFEHALESKHVPVFDGFVGSHQPYFHPESLTRSETRPGNNWTRVWKMHGSVNWKRLDVGGRPRIVRGEISSGGEMIFPSFDKYEESRQQPYSAFTDQLRRFLERDDALLIVLGFSFGDDHINELIFGALENRPRTHVYALQYSTVDEESPIALRAKDRSNMIVFSPGAAVVGGEYGAWVEGESLAVSRSVCQCTDERGLEVGIGDFSFFAEFLVSMVRQ